MKNKIFFPVLAALVLSSVLAMADDTSQFPTTTNSGNAILPNGIPNQNPSTLAPNINTNNVVAPTNNAPPIVTPVATANTIPEGIATGDNLIVLQLRQYIQSAYPTVSPQSFSIISNNGDVTINGTAASRAEAEAIAAKANTINGVKSVTNNLSIQP